MSREVRTYTFAVVVEPADEGMWHAYCPTLLAYGFTRPYLSPANGERRRVFWDWTPSRRADGLSCDGDH
jgi:hypothetical protein